MQSVKATSVCPVWVWVKQQSNQWVSYACIIIIAHTHTGTCHLTMVSKWSVGLCEVWLGSMMGLDMTGLICLRWFGGLGAICYVEVSSKRHKLKVKARSIFKSYAILTKQHKTLGTFHIAQILNCSFHVQQKMIFMQNVSYYLSSNDDCLLKWLLKCHYFPSKSYA